GYSQTLESGLHQTDRADSRTQIASLREPDLARSALSPLSQRQIDQEVLWLELEAPLLGHAEAHVDRTSGDRADHQARVLEIQPEEREQAAQPLFSHF